MYRFSGEVDGLVTSRPANGVPAGASTRNPSTKSAASFIAGYACRRRNSAIAAEFVVVPHLVRKPSSPTGQIPQGPSTGAVARQRSVLWCSTQPRLWYSMRAVSAPVTRKSWIKTPQRRFRLPQIAGIRLPVIHLQVDVCRPLTAPRGSQVLIPDSLQVCRLTSGPGRRDQQVAAELEVERDQARIVILCKIRDAAVRRVGGRSCPRRSLTRVKKAAENRRRAFAATRRTIPRMPAGRSPGRRPEHRRRYRGNS